MSLAIVPVIATVGWTVVLLVLAPVIRGREEDPTPDVGLLCPPLVTFWLTFLVVLPFFHCALAMCANLASSGRPGSRV